MAASWLKRALRRWLADDTQVKAAPTRRSGRTIYGDKSPRSTLTEKQADHTAQVNETLRLSMLGTGPGWWASDHAEEAQHFTGWNYCAIHAKAKQAAQASIRVYHRTPAKIEKDDATRQKDAAHDQQEYDRTPLPASNEWVRLFEKPNPRWTGGMWRYQAIQQLDLTGSILIWKVRDQMKHLRELWVIPTALARPQMPSAKFPMGAYWITATGLFTLTGGLAPMPTVSVGAMSGLTIDARDIHPVRWPHPILMADGQSPLNAGSVQTDLAEEVDNAAWSAMNNVVDPSMVLSLDSSMQVDDTELDRIEQKINANRGGSQGRAKIWILQGCKPEQLHRSPAEIDYKDSRQQARDNVLAIQGIPSVATGAPSDTGTYSAYYVQLQQAIELTIQPELDLLASELTRLLHEETGDETLEVQISCKSFNDPDVADKKLNTNIAAKSITINEVRKAEGKQPVAWGDVQVGTVIPPHLISPEFFPDPVELAQELHEATGGNDPQSGNGSATGTSTGIKRNPKPAAKSLRAEMNAWMLNGVSHGA